MARVVVLGAGVSGHTASMTLKRLLGKKHEVIVVSPNSHYQWIPSNIWVGVGRMKAEKVIFKLAPVYKKKGIDFKQALAEEIYPEGNGHLKDPFVKIRYTGSEKNGQEAQIHYDYLINATGPKLHFDAIEGLGPKGFTESVCTYQHAIEANNSLEKVYERLKQGEKQTIVVGTGHPKATCQGAAFEYILNIAFELRKRKLQHLADLIWLTNEYELGDFGMGGAYVKRSGYITSTKVFSESILAENGISWIKRAGVKKIEKGFIHFETLEGEHFTQKYDFAMLIPGFSGVGLKSFNKSGQEITETLFAKNGFMKVDANYTQKNYTEWAAEDWPSIYQNPSFKNIYAAGIAFAPPHGISKPMQSPNGTEIFPTPPRTGMPSGVTGKIIAQNIAKRIKNNDNSHKHQASMARMGAACIVSGGYGAMKGMAATLTVYPIVPDRQRYPQWGRDLSYTVGEAGLAGHWIKLLLHHMFLYKAKGKAFWWMIPE